MSAQPQMWTAASLVHATAVNAPIGVRPVTGAASPSAGRNLVLRLLVATGRIVFRLAVTAVTLLFLVLAALPLVQHKVLIVTSGSMEPLLSAGDVAVIHTSPVEELGSGDVITYQGYSDDRLTTHRIVKPVELDSGLHFQTKGDANAAPDPNLAPGGGVVGRYVVGIPEAGRLLLFISQPHGRLLVIGLPALLTLATELRYLVARRQTSRLARRPRLAWAAGLTLLVVATGVGTLMATGAVITDADLIDANTFSTADAFGA